MSSTARIDELKVTEQNIAYYNEVASIYNSIMESDQANETVRRRVRDKFRSLLREGTVLDFGGGTGLDLEWLTQTGYTVFFCEPSAGMRKEAKQLATSTRSNDTVIFMEDSKTDFTTWPASCPFDKKVDGILCNFGVINYIPGIRELFKSLAGVIGQGGNLVVVVLELSLRKRWKWHRSHAAQSLLFRRTFRMHIPYNQHKQLIFVHTIGEVKKASGPYFTFAECTSLNARDFTLIHLVRNEKPC